MPVITFEAGAMSDDVKAELLTRLTDVAVEVTGIPKHLYFVSIMNSLIRILPWAA